MTMTDAEKDRYVLVRLAGMLLDACERAEACKGQAVGSDTIRAYCKVMRDLTGSTSIVSGLDMCSFAAASGEWDHAKKQAIQLGNVIHGRPWFQGNGREKE